MKNHLWRGDIDALDAEIEVVSDLARATRKPWWWGQAVWMRALQAGMRGQFAEAQQHAAEAARQEGRRHDAQGSPVPGLFSLFLRCASGSDDASREIDAGIPAGLAALPLVGAALGLLASERGEADEARGHLQLGAADGFGGMAREWTSSCILAHFAETGANLGDRTHAATLYELLRPRAGLVASFNYYISLGAVDRYLGLLAATLGDWTHAAEHFEAALGLNTRMRAYPWLAYTQRDYAALLWKRWQETDADAAARQRAMALAQAAARTATQLGMTRLLRNTSQLLLVINRNTP